MRALFPKRASPSAAITVYLTRSPKRSVNAQGFAFYLEDGVEEHNVFEHNFAGHVHPIYRPADGSVGQGGETFTQSSALLVPADVSASGFYVSNSYNTFVGNAASGGWSGFAFPNLPTPIGDFKGQDWGSNNPMLRPCVGVALSYQQQ